MEVAQELMGIPAFEKPDFSALFSEENAMVSKLKKVALMIAGKAVEIHGMELEKQQQLVSCIAEIIIEIYLAESTLLKTEKRVQQAPDVDSKAQIAMAQLNLFNAVELISSKAKEAIFSLVKGDEQQMLLMGLKRFTKYHNHPDAIALRKSIASKLISENRYSF